MSCFCCCASVFKGSICLESQPSQISCFNTRVSPCSFDPPITSLCQFHVIDGGYIKALLRQVYSCRLQHIIQGTRLRNQLVPWDLHALMAGLLTSDSGLTSLTSDRMIPWMFDFSSSIHIRWNVLSTLGIIDINGDLPRAC
jgi:hypothetical protein